MKRIPIVGITAGIEENGKIMVAADYAQAVALAGALPIILAPAQHRDEVWYQVQAIDGLVLSGGGDISPLLYGQEPECGIEKVDTMRDEWEIALCRQSVQEKRAVLGICRGMQVLNVALGGDVYADIGRRADILSHRQTSGHGTVWHTVHYTAGSLMERLFGSVQAVNSYHHQAVRRVGTGLTVTGTAADGIIEAIESTDGRCLGVQYHPELLPDMRPLWQIFIKMAGNVKE